jgi:hypothetical protein
MTGWGRSWRLGYIGASSCSSLPHGVAPRLEVETDTTRTEPFVGETALPA